MDKSHVPASVDDYIAHCDPEVRDTLHSIRNTIREAAPDAQEKISYQMPAFAQNGILVYFAAFKNHIGFFPTAEGIEAFKDELNGYKCSKGTIQLPLDKPIPYDLIKMIVKHRVDMNMKQPGKAKSLIGDCYISQPHSILEAYSSATGLSA